MMALWIIYKQVVYAYFWLIF
uniref:Uncharacterized protein n=1 Tax=Arundo donax TaxID=35708 RepID=A0A0A9AWZ8_ARUDO